jgi:CysZ protein
MLLLYPCRMLKALVDAVADLLHPRMLWLMVWPVGLSLVLWGLVGILFGGQAVDWLATNARESTVGEWLARWLPVDAVASGVGWLLLIALGVPLVLVTASVILGVFSMPAMVAHVAQRNFPTLERYKGGTVAGSIVNALLAIVVFLALGLLSLPLWLIPPLWPVLAALLMGYLNQRLFRYDALAEHASATEMMTVFRRYRGSLYVLGVIVSLLSYVPLAGLVVPVVAGLAFIHYCLGRLAILRSGAGAA